MVDLINLEPNLQINVVRKKIKNIYLSITRTGDINLTVPVRTASPVIEQFINSKLAWIKKQRVRQSCYVAQTLREYITGEIHYFRAKSYILNIITNTNTNTNTNHIQIVDNKYLNLYLNNLGAITPKYVLIKWYREQFNLIVQPLLIKWQSIIGVSIGSLQIKTMRTRWGSCHTTNKNISLNLELIKMPAQCLEYVVVHELVHILEASHNHRFKALMTTFLPDWQIYKQELNNFVLNHDIGML